MSFINLKIITDITSNSHLWVADLHCHFIIEKTSGKEIVKIKLLSASAATQKMYRSIFQAAGAYSKIADISSFSSGYFISN